MYTRLRKSLPNCSSILKNAKRRYVSTELDESNKVIYPPIIDPSYNATVKRKHQMFADKIKKLESVEEKLFGLNMPRYYGWKSLYLEERIVQYNSLQQAQYITKTHITNDNKLPNFYNAVITPEQLDVVVQLVKPCIENILSFEYYNRLRKHEIKEDTEESKRIQEDNIINCLVYNINRILLSTLSSALPQLMEVQIDFEPRVEAFWFGGGINPPDFIKNKRKRNPAWKEHIDDLVNIPIQYYGSPILQLRHVFPLKQIVSLTECSNPELSIPEFTYDPRVLGYTFQYKHATSIPGFWPGDPSEFGLLSYHNMNNLSPSGKIDADSYKVQAIFASYGWLLSQAYYQGFSTLHDITYPLVSQTVLTNGQIWSFCIYQLNTTLVSSEDANENSKRNMCWIMEPMKLFDKIEDGKIHGFNEDVLKTLIKLYVNVPAERIGVNMKPYLGESVKHISDIQDRDRRVWLEGHFKHLMSNRPRHFQVPEVYAWQKIYMVDHNTRPLDKKIDPWQFGYKPMKRRLNEHLPIYVPKCLRENPKKKKIGRWAKTYYPDV